MRDGRTGAKAADASTSGCDGIAALAVPVADPLTSGRAIETRPRAPAAGLTEMPPNACRQLYWPLKATASTPYFGAAAIVRAFSSASREAPARRRSQAVPTPGEALHAAGREAHEDPGVLGYTQCLSSLRRSSARRGRRSSTGRSAPSAPHERARPASARLAARGRPHDRGARPAAARTQSSTTSSSVWRTPRAHMRSEAGSRPERVAMARMTALSRTPRRAGMRERFVERWIDGPGCCAERHGGRSGGATARACES